MLRILEAVWVAAAVSCMALAEPQTPPAPAAERLASDTPRSTPGGATFLAPKDWSVIVSGPMILLSAPEGDTQVAIVDVKAADAAAAVASAWTTFRPDEHRPLKLATPIPARDGWDERCMFDYETSPNERQQVSADAMRLGSAWTVLIMDGSSMTFGKRGSQLSLIAGSLRPKGYQRESFAGRKALPLTPARIDQLKSFVEESMRKLAVPGAGLALLDGGKVVYEGGIGVRELGKPEKVDANTLFMAASNTKGMTTLLLAMLADDQKLRWDQPVTQIYPAFKLGNADTTRQVLVKHLICACTGLPRQDLEWIFEFQDATPATSLALLATMQPTSRFGELFQYSNLMAAAAGYIGGHLYEPAAELGAAYDDAMQQRIFTPLGMQSTTFDMAKAQRGNHSSPHGDDPDGKARVASMAFNYAVVPHRPAGGVWTSAHDLARYVQLELGRGQIEGKRLVSEENLLMRRKPQVSLGEDRDYGMGLMVDRTWGVPVVHHGGSLAGYKSDLIFLPDSGIGAVLLTNADNGGMLLRPLMRRLLEVAFDGRQEAVGDVDGSAAAYRAALAKDRERLVIPAAPAEVAKLAPRYHSAALGDISVVHDAQGTVFDFGEWKSAVASRKNDDGAISFITISPATDGFEFVVGERAGKRVLVIRDGQHEYVFNAVS